MKCQQVREEIAAFLSGELIQEKKDAVDQHILNCASCARELLRIKKLEQELEQGLEDWMAEEAKNEGLGDWLMAQSHQMSEQQREEKRAWVSGLGETKGQTDSRPAQKVFRPWQRVRVAAAVILAIFMLVTYWPQAVRASTYMPILGPWVQKLVLRDAGLNWAYENGYIKDSLVSAERDGVKLTILGAVADSVHTTVIYLVDGLQADTTNVYIREVNGEGVASWTEPGSDTPLGKVGMAQTRALPAGENVLTVVLRQGGNLSGDLEVNITLDREEISRLSQSFDLAFVDTVDGITVTARRVIYTPTQVMVEYTVSGGGTLHGTVRPEYRMYLLSAEGMRLDSVVGIGSYVDGQWELQQVFNRPQNASGLKMVIPALGRYEEVALEFGPEDLNTEKEVFGSKLMLSGWHSSAGRLEVTIIYPSGAVQTLGNWTVTGAGGEPIKVMGQGNIWGGSVDDTLRAITDVLHIEIGTAPVRASVSKVQVIVPGNWQIALPSAE